MKWLVFLLAAGAYAGEFRWVEKNPSQLELLENGRPVFTYNHGDGRQCCYLHPLLSPSGVVLTDDGPADHRHHRGLFWAWPILEVAGRRHDSWLLTGVTHRPEGIAVHMATSSEATLRARHSWVVDGNPVLRDTIAITVHPVDGSTRLIDVTLTLEAVSQPVVLAGAPELNKGYGGLSARFAPRTETTLRSSEGDVPVDEDHGAHRWAELLGSFTLGRAGLRLTADPANPGFPNHWCLRHYGFLGANFPGVERFQIDPGKTVTLRYQVRVFDTPGEGSPGRPHQLD